MPEVLKNLTVQAGVYRPFRFLYDHVCARSRLAESRRNIAFFRQFIDPGDLVFDVGANIGDKTAAFLQLGANVVAFEPQAACRTELLARFAHKGSFSLVEAAVGAAPGNVKLYLSDKNSQFASVNPCWHDVTSRFVNVPVVTLDQVIAQHGTPRFCKIDVEGYELDVLRGLSSVPDCLSFEYHLDEHRLENTLACLDHISSMGKVRFNLSPIEDLKLHEDEWLNYELFLRLLDRLRLDNHFFYGDIYVRSV